MRSGQTGCAELAELQHQHRAGEQRGGQIGHGDGDPNTVARGGPCRDDVRKNEDAGHEKQQLAREREEDALAGHADALEEGGGDDLHADERPEERENAQAARSGGDERGVAGKERDKLFGNEVAEGKTGGGDARGDEERALDHREEAIETPRAVVVAGDGEHALIESHDDKADEHRQTIDDAVGPHADVAAISVHRTHEQTADERRAGIDEKLRHADDDGFAHDAPIGAKDLGAKADHIAGTREEIDLPHEHRNLRDERSPGGAANAPAEVHDEKIGQEGVDGDAAQIGIHGQARTVGAAELGVESVIEVRHDVAPKLDAHVVAGVGERVVARSEETKHGFEKEKQRHAERKSHDDVEDHDIAQDGARGAIVFLPEADAHERGAAHAHHGAESGGECHERIAERQPGDAEGADGLSDEDGVHDVVERGGDHGDDRRHGILEQ